MDRALREFRIRGVATNLRFLEHVITHPNFRDGAYTTRSSTRRRSCSSCQAQARPRDQAPHLHRRRHRQRPPGSDGSRRARAASCDARPPQLPVGDAAARHQAAARRARRRRSSPTGCASRSACWSPTRPCATRTSRCSRRACAATTSSAIAPAYARLLPQLFSLECWGGATFDVAMRFLHEDPVGAARRDPRGDAEHPAADAAARANARRLHQLSRQRRALLRAAGGEGRHRPLPRLRLPQLGREHARRDGRGARGRQALRRRHLLHRRHPRSAPAKYDLKYYVELAKRAGAGRRAHPRHQGHGGPVQAARRAHAGQGAQGRDRPADPLPHPRHLRHRGGHRARGGRGRRRCRRRGDGRDVRPHLAAVLGSLVEALRHGPRDPGSTPTTCA